MRIDRRRPIPLSAVVPSSRVSSQRASLPYARPPMPRRRPSGPMWLHEIKHDGFRVVAKKQGERVKLYSRPGTELTFRCRLIVDALTLLRQRSCIIDGEAVACREDGIAEFERIRYQAS